MLEDQKNWNVAYWHRQHQLPGVWICLSHNVLLLESTAVFAGPERVGWCLPAHNQLQSPFKAGTALKMPNTEILQKLAHSANSLTSLPSDFLLEAPRLAQAYEYALGKRGLLLGKNGQ